VIAAISCGVHPALGELFVVLLRKAGRGGAEARVAIMQWSDSFEVADGPFCSPGMPECSESGAGAACAFAVASAGAGTGSARPSGISVRATAPIIAHAERSRPGSRARL
jgi:hypothetical protein